jgi:hypothetical protein
VLVAVSKQDGVSFYSDHRLAELLGIRYPHELEAARRELVARDLIVYERGLYQVLDLPPARSPAPGRVFYQPLPESSSRSARFPRSSRRTPEPAATPGWVSLNQLLERSGRGR